MRFADLLNYYEKSDFSVIPVRHIAKRIEADHPHVGQILFWPVELDPEISLGHIVYEKDRESVHSVEFTVANIRFDKNLNRCWRRFVCCKEMMHLFDDAAERVDSREKFLRLMGEFETSPLPEDFSPMYDSEFNAQWMALTVLCPPRLRNAYRDEWKNQTISDYDVALRFKIPEVCVRALMGDYYERAVDRLSAQLS